MCHHRQWHQVLNKQNCIIGSNSWHCSGKLKSEKNIHSWHCSIGGIRGAIGTLPGRSPWGSAAALAALGLGHCRGRRGAADDYGDGQADRDGDGRWGRIAHRRGDADGGTRCPRGEHTGPGGGGRRRMQRMAMAAAEDGPRVPACIPIDVERHHGTGACARKEDEGTTARRAGATMEVHGGGNGVVARWFLGSPSGSFLNQRRT